MDTPPITDSLYRVTHTHDGVALMRIIAVGDTFATVEMVDELDGTYQIATGVRFKVIIEQCTFELADV